jgi:hypothetical protein
MVPIGRGEPIAAMGAYWRDKRAFDDRDVTAVQTLASSVSDAIRRIGA